MNRWGVYEMLKGNNINIKEIETIPAEEVKEGVIEYLLTREKELVEV